MKDGMPCMLFYKTGLISAVMPEIGIRYNF